MSAEGKTLGILRPVGGGDPIPLTKPEIAVGRRPTNDIQLNFENVSGKHCVLRYIKGVWHARDLGSSNGTTVNGQKFMGEHSILPDDELGVASHYYRIDYEPSAPDSVINSNRLLIYDDDLVEKGNRQSLMELAGLDRQRSSSSSSSSSSRSGSGSSANLSASSSSKRTPQRDAMLDDDLETPPASKPQAEPQISDDDFLKFFDDSGK